MLCVSRNARMFAPSTTMRGKLFSTTTTPTSAQAGDRCLAFVKHAVKDKKGAVFFGASSSTTISASPTAAASSSPLSRSPHNRSMYHTVSGGRQIRPELEAATTTTDVLTTGQQQQQQQSRGAGAGATTRSPVATLRYAHTLLPTARTADGLNNWEFPNRLPMEIFRGDAKDQWIDADKGWCYLCQEPIGSGHVGSHIGDRDHSNLAIFLYYYSMYPRRQSGQQQQQQQQQQHAQQSAALRAASYDDHRHNSTSSEQAALLRDAFIRFPSLAMHVFGQPMSVEHLHTWDDTNRRAELESLLIHLCHPPHRAITHSLVGKAPRILWSSGERMFKVTASRMVSTMVPPLAAGFHSQFCQKVWSRSNLERLYDALNIAVMHSPVGGPIEPKVGKIEKAFFMRCVFWELYNFLDGCRDDSFGESNYSVAGRHCGGGREGEHTDTECEENDDDAMGDEERENNNIVEDYHTTQLLVAEVLRRMSFELMFLQSMNYMNRVQDLAGKIGFPGYRELEALHSL